jgi:hypothetical protein
MIDRKSSPIAKVGRETNATILAEARKPAQLPCSNGTLSVVCAKKSDCAST